MKITTKFGMMAIALMAAAPAMGQAEFSGAGQEIDLDCGGATAMIEGGGNTASVDGDCKSLTVTGASNTVHVRMAKSGLISIEGAGNRVYWTTPDGTRPRVKVVGAGNSVSKDAGAR